jgi:hypothetical protein
MAEEIQVYEDIEDAEIVESTSLTLFRTDDPTEVVTRAISTADALMGVVNKRKAELVSNISGKEFPKVECWSLLGTMLGVFPVTVWTRAVMEADKVIGFEARVEARTRDGSIVGAAESMCTRHERTWKTRDDFALRGMAETRATSRALRKPLGFVMTLAGLEATSAEEMDGVTAQEQRSDGQRQASGARSWSEWKKLMLDLEVPQPDEWLKLASEAAEVPSSAWGGELSQRANRVLLHFADNPPEGTLGFLSVPEIQKGYAVGFDGVVVDNSQPQVETTDEHHPLLATPKPKENP